MTDQPDQTPLADGTPVSPPNPAATGTEPGKPSGATTPPEKTFTQADLDNIVRERVAKEQATTLKKLGVAKLDDATAAISKVKEIEESQKTEQEKLAEKAREAEYRAMQLEERSKSALFEAAFIKQASKPGMVSGDRLDAAWKLLDTTKLSINDNGGVEGAADALTALLEAYPFLKAESTKPTPAPKIPASNPAGTGSGEPDLSWLKTKNHTGTFNRGGVRPPPGEE